MRGSADLFYSNSATEMVFSRAKTIACLKANGKRTERTAKPSTPTLPAT